MMFDTQIKEILKGIGLWFVLTTISIGLVLIVINKITHNRYRGETRQSQKYFDPSKVAMLVGKAEIELGGEWTTVPLRVSGSITTKGK